VEILLFHAGDEQEVPVGFSAACRQDPCLQTSGEQRFVDRPRRHSYFPFQVAVEVYDNQSVICQKRFGLPQRVERKNMRRKGLTAVNIKEYQVILFFGLLKVVPGIVNDYVHSVA
jgi:hypothetical protein